MPGFLKATASNPRHLFRHRNIFLMSHMRANTSLFAHILGSHPAIEGYYEMHIGYYSWKSLWRQKLLHFAKHEAKPHSHTFFDKLLHNYCIVAPELLSRPSTKVIMMLRAPERTIKSIISMYRKIDPGHVHADPVQATRYYVDRLAALRRIAQSLPARFYYLDAEALVDSPDSTLAELSSWLNLTPPLSSEYQLFANTGKGNFGDNSETIRSGKIVHSNSSYDSIELPAGLLAEATADYLQCRDELVALSDKHEAGSTR